ncbi:hypothetical protein SEA_OCTOBIEN14_102 [Gordonia phage Octobien14]|uniref:Uncharacterized protein n=1 Tax=Gordonia phage Octobien14 TaxID=2483673 RepID=A0A3G3M9W6_9CAUD|nr:hypothetical protein L3Y22_gp141 [Gordonia phage Octobien14]AYR03241.1 hypothetical protein SEA_OCTOBIEN14_102 [Gordonia phage Octobien14]
MGFRDLFTPRTKRQKKAKGKGEQLGRAIGELTVSAQGFTESVITPRVGGKLPMSNGSPLESRGPVRPAPKPRSYESPSYSGYDHSPAIAAAAVSSSYSSPSYSSSCDSSSSSSFSSDCGGGGF